MCQIQKETSEELFKNEKKFYIRAAISENTPVQNLLTLM